MLNIILLGITSLLTDISSEMVYPILPIYLVTRLGVSPAILGLIEGVAESLASLLKVFSGFFSDKTGQRRPFAILGYASSTIGKFLLYISNSWLYVFAGRAVDRIGKGIRTAPRDALIAESSQESKRGSAFGLHRAMDTLGATIGVLWAYFLIVHYSGNTGSLQELNRWAGRDEFKNIFLFSLIPASLGVAVLFLVREKRKTVDVLRRQLKFRWSSLDRRLKLFLIFSFIFTLGNSSNQFLLLRAQNLGAALPKIILFYLFYNIIHAAVSYPAARLSDRLGRKKVLVSGYVFYALVYLGFALTKSVNNLWFLFGLYGLYSGFTEGVEKALVVDIAPANLRGTAIGLHATLVGAGLLPASLLAGILWKFWGAQAAFGFGSIMGMLASVGLWFILAPQPPELGGINHSS